MKQLQAIFCFHALQCLQTVNNIFVANMLLSFNPVEVRSKLVVHLKKIPNTCNESLQKQHYLSLDDKWDFYTSQSGAFLHLQCLFHAKKSQGRKIMNSRKNVYVNTIEVVNMLTVNTCFERLSSALQ